MPEVTIQVEEYKDLIERTSDMAARIEAFKEFVNNSEYAIDRRMCGIFLGFKVEEKG